MQEDGDLQGNEFEGMENEFQGFNADNIAGGDIIVQDTDELGMINDPTSQPGSFVGIPEDNDIDQERRTAALPSVKCTSAISMSLLRLS